MKKGQTKTIKIPGRWSGESVKIDAYYLGAGQFSKCYTHDGFVYSFVKDGQRESDYSKQALSTIRESGNPHIPEFENLNNLDSFDGQIYKSPLYNPLKNGEIHAWQTAKKLKNIWESHWVNSDINLSGYESNLILIEKFKESGKFTDQLINAIELINDAGHEYGENYILEFPLRNMVVNSIGDLILLDVLFNVNAILEKRKHQKS